MIPHDVLWIIITKLLDIFIGALAFVGMLWRWKVPRNSVNTSDLLKMLEEKDRQIERLTLQYKAWKIRYDHRTNHCKTNHLPRE